MKGSVHLNDAPGSAQRLVLLRAGARSASTTVYSVSAPRLATPSRMRPLVLWSWSAARCSRTTCTLPRRGSPASCSS